MTYYSNSIGGILQSWADLGVFAYLLPFLMIFAVVYGILSQSKILGENKGVNATIALTVGLLALQFGYVSTFFGSLFPYTGMGIAVLLVAMILMGLIGKEGGFKWIWFVIGLLIFIVVLMTSFSDWSWWGNGSYDLQGSLPAILSGVLVIAVLALIIFGDRLKGK